ncbi:MAG: hypothetical protein V5B40_08830 [Candidatus Accumulibacter meliphilus]|uniref:hypothetical protein n=1 Tax=Candidatus Accumulibacter meliphilus TaxID=2211374 RepID=UPI002FC2C5C2
MTQRGLLEFEEVGLDDLFHRRRHHVFITTGVVTAHQSESFFGDEPIEPGAQTGQAVFGSCGLFHVEY